MKHGNLIGVGHNLADSVVSGLGLMIGVYAMDIFGEAAKTQEGYIEVDFLTGATAGGAISTNLAHALELYALEALPRLCADHAIAPSAFRELKVRFWRHPAGGRFKVSVEDEKGRRTTAEYEGSPAHRLKILDHLGRPRPKQ